MIWMNNSCFKQKYPLVIMITALIDIIMYHNVSNQLNEQAGTMYRKLNTVFSQHTIISLLMRNSQILPHTVDIVMMTIHIYHYWFHFTECEIWELWFYHILLFISPYFLHQILCKLVNSPGTHFTNDFSITIQIRRNSFSSNSITADHIETKLGTCHDSPAVVPCAKVCSDH